MKKVLKKILPVLKRACALMGVVAVLVCSFVVPACALDFDSGQPKDLMYPLFNYDSVEVTYSDGSSACFNLREVFYQSYMDDKILSFQLRDLNGTDRQIGFTFNDLTFEQVNIVVSDVEVTLPYWRLSFDMTLNDIRSFRLNVGETIYDYSSLNVAFNNNHDMLYFYNENYSQNQNAFSVSNNGLFYFPKYSYRNGSIVGRSMSEKDLSYSLSAASSSVSISPLTSVSSLISLMPEANHTYLYFSDYDVDFTVPEDAYYARFVIHYIPEYSRPSFASYRGTYFPNYYINEADISVDFTGWINSALTGFLNFEFGPGLKISTLLLFVLGIGAFNIFLKFFAGG